MKNAPYFKEKILTYIATEIYLCIMVLESGFCYKSLFIDFYDRGDSIRLSPYSKVQVCYSLF